MRLYGLAGNDVVMPLDAVMSRPWLASMVLVVYGALRGGGPPEAEPPVRKQKLDELLDRYVEDT
jgi:hypothetical protein